MIQDMFDSIYEIVAAIPAGFVMSYGDVAKLAGVKNPRWVGRAMHMNSNPQHIPCHRVVHVDGALAPHYAFGGRDVQKEKLLYEGVKFIGERVNMTTCRALQNVM